MASGFDMRQLRNKHFRLHCMAAGYESEGDWGIDGH